ncbi:MAG: nucleotide-binding protein [Methanospirillaceae archaeon]|nr:nucleotide-binding protein [Methanospirillaceae archaeon]
MASHRDGDSARIILFDTNGLMMASQFTLDVFEEVRWLVGTYQPVVLDGIIRELRRLGEGKGNNASAARYALKLTQDCITDHDVVEQESVDDTIIRYARDTGCIVVTNDRRLREQLLMNHIDVISLSHKKRLEMIRG